MVHTLKDVENHPAEPKENVTGKQIALLD